MEIASKAKANQPAAYLRNTLRNALVEFAGLCQSEAEAAAMMGQLLSAARPLARPLFAGVRGQSPALPRPPTPGPSFSPLTPDP